MLKKLIPFLLAAQSLFAAHVSTITPLDGEKWYGAATMLGDQMPFSTLKKKVDLNVSHMANQAAPFLLSSKGRYVWSEKPFALDAKDGVITLTSDFEKLEPVAAGSTLRDAFLAAAKKHFAPDGRIPPEEFFTKPQFNTWIELVREQSTENILKYARDIAANGFPCGVLMIDGGWDRCCGMLDFDAKKIPDPKALNRAIHDMGYKAIYWVGPFVGSVGAEFLEWEKAEFQIDDAGLPCGAFLTLERGDFDNPEAYRLRVSEDGISIVSASDAGARAALQTLRQIGMQADSRGFRFVEMEDSPDIGARCFVLDISRGRVPTLADMRLLADRLSLFKYNRLELRLGGAYPFEGREREWAGRGLFTPKKIAALKKYCAALGIELSCGLDASKFQYGSREISEISANFDCVYVCRQKSRHSGSALTFKLIKPFRSYVHKNAFLLPFTRTSCQFVS